MVELWRIPRVEQTWAQMADVNWAPRSEVKVAGTPNREIQPWNRAEAQLAVDISARGRASGHLVDLSTMVKR